MPRGVLATAPNRSAVNATPHDRALARLMRYRQQYSDDLHVDGGTIARYGR